MPSEPPPAFDEFAVPDQLQLEERQIWLKLAPHAVKARTLTKATELAFVILCQNIVLEAQMRSSIKTLGGQTHRAMMQRVEVGMVRFCLMPNGKPIFESEEQAKPVNPLERFLKHG